jgi:hypothetical protein
MCDARAVVHVLVSWSSSGRNNSGDSFNCKSTSKGSRSRVDVVEQQ